MTDDVKRPWFAQDARDALAASWTFVKPYLGLIPAALLSSWQALPDASKASVENTIPAAVLAMVAYAIGTIYAIEKARRMPAPPQTIAPTQEKDP
jgi:hypothetical protein